MPVISVTLLSGYTADAKTRVVGRLAHAVRSVIPASEAGTTVILHEASTYQRDGRVMETGAAALPEATQIVHDFLEAMGQRDLAAAAQCVAPGFEMVFPGNRRMRELAELGVWASARYRGVQKNYERFDESWQGGHTVVFCSGTLFGQWLDGRAFEGVRFIDRFEVEGGKIRLQEVWNDLGEHR
jgi:phenylpyruvate tautomerase PptA (4-oxalocrotonate tautomerase family)/ketosteroid isomerase-like protein